MSGVEAEGFDRAPGAERSRGRASGPRPADTNLTRRPELRDGPSVFTHCEPLRQPHTPPLNTEKTERASSTPQPPTHSISSTSIKPPRPETTLSVNAPEFYPSTYQPDHPAQQEEHQQYDELCVYSEEEEVSLADMVLDILSFLNSSPGSFETDIENMTASLNGYVMTEETLQELVDLIFTQSTSMPNFTYTGARLCNHLSHHLTLTPTSGNFRQLLLKRCHTEYEGRHQALVGDDESRRKFHNYILFLGELYLNLEVKGVNGTMSRADVLLLALKELMDMLLSQPSDSNLICAVKLLKLTGSVLEETWRQTHQNHMEDLMSRFKNIVLDSQCSRDVKEMLMKLMDLRSSYWGRISAAVMFNESTPENDPNYYMNEPTFYTADGTPFTAADPEYSEKYQEILDREDYFPEFLEENGHEELCGDEDDDEMGPEIEEAYEKFCQETERMKR